jgi:5-methylcytosine-specific restriction endonuclease McrA
MSTHSLLLNTSFEPLHVVTWQKAIQLLFQGKVEVVEESDREIRTVRFTIKVPAVLRLLSYIPLTKKHYMIRFSRSNVFIRDHYQCQYCGIKQAKANLTLDHVIPVVQGGKKTWENIVTCCKGCNQKKGGRTPAQAGLKLVKRASAPAFLPKFSLELKISFVPDKWRVYLSY